MIRKLILAGALSLAALSQAALVQAKVVDNTETGGPEIVIKHDDKGTYYEYSINGQIKEIKVVPKVGKPYYLVPADGSKQYIRAEESTLLIPKWVIFRW